MNLRTHIAVSLLFGLLGCKAQKESFMYANDRLKVERLTNSTFRHISYITTQDFGKVACNGMMVVNSGKALIFDTPTNDQDSHELIDWVEKNLNAKVIGIVVTHFHDDCLGGLKAFHDRQIPSYASFKTIELARKDSAAVPQNGFDSYLEIPIGDKKVVNEFFGEGHTKDNIVSYFAHEKVLFGGCLIKSLGASKGYLGDATTNEWSKTVLAIKDKYPYIKVVVPGHGNPGGSDLLTYTAELFKTP